MSKTTFDSSICAANQSVAGPRKSSTLSRSQSVTERGVLPVSSAPLSSSRQAHFPERCDQARAAGPQPFGPRRTRRAARDASCESGGRNVRAAHSAAGAFDMNCRGQFGSPKAAVILRHRYGKQPDSCSRYNVLHCSITRTISTDRATISVVTSLRYCMGRDATR